MAPGTAVAPGSELESLLSATVAFGKNIQDFGKSTKHFISTFKLSCFLRDLIMLET